MSTSARDRLICAHLGLASAAASRFVDRGVERDDLVQVAYLGLVKAAHRYQPQRGAFPAFASPTITGELKRYFRDHGWMVRPPRWLQELQAQERALLTGDTHPPDDDVAQVLGTSADRVREARAARGCFVPRSFDAPVGPTGDTLADSLAEDRDAYSALDEVLSLRPACAALNDADRALLRMRFVEERTQSDIAGELGISQMQVSRRLARVLSTLRTHLTAEPAAA